MKPLMNMLSQETVTLVPVVFSIYGMIEMPKKLI